ncbi:methyltransferase domain-containing protein [Luminiphilus sp.]|nr:methyltransferase domain-containing protein [Luminiphilus sp.]
MDDLNQVVSQYQPNAVTAIENDLILHWYPKRIINRTGSVDSLLELGLGHGYTACCFNKVCNRHVILDGSSVVVDQFTADNPDFSGEVRTVFFEDYDSDMLFDVVVMGFILEHVDDPRQILEKFKKNLRPGGKLYIAVPNAKSMNRRIGLELGLIDDIYSLNDNDHALGHKRQYCLESLKQEVSDAGYVVTHEEGIYLKPLPLPILKTLPEFQRNLEAMCEVGVDFPQLCVGLLLEAIVP